MNQKNITFLLRINGWRLWGLITCVVIVLTELIGAIMELALTGRITLDYFIIGFVVSGLIAPMGCVFLSFVLGELAKEQQRELVSREQYANSRLNIAIENSRIVLWEYDFARDEFQYDAAMLHVLGVTSTVPAKNLSSWIELVHPDDREAFIAHVQVLLTGGDPVFDIEYRLTQRPGSWGWVHTMGKVVQRDADGKPQLVVGSTTNIDARKLAEIGLLEAKQRFEIIFNNSPDVMLISRLPDGRISEVNEAFSLVTGYSKQDAIGQTTLELGLWSRVEDRQVMMASLAATGRCTDLEAEYRARDGSLGLGSLSAIATSLQGVPHIVSTVRDITERKRIENEAFRSRLELDTERQLFQAILDNAPLAIWMLDMEGRIRFINKTFCDAVGVLEQTFVSARSYVDVLPASITDNCLRSDRECLAQEAPHVSTEWLPFVDGKEHLLAITKVKLFDHEKNVVGLIGLGVDITERMRAEQESRANEQKLLTILDNVDAFIYLKDAEGRYLFANKAVRELWHAQMEDVVGYGDEKFFDAQTVENIQRNDRRVLVLGEILRSEESNTVTATGATATYLSTKLPLRREDGSIYALCGISTNITERKLAEEKLRQHKQFSDDIIDSLPGVFYVLSQQGRFVRFNSRFLEVSGYSKAEFEQLPVLELFEDDHKRLIAQRMQEVFEKGSSWAEAELVTKTGQKVQYHFTGHLTTIEGVPYLVGTGTDVSERQRVMEQLRRAADELASANTLIEHERAQLASRVEERTAQLVRANKAKDSFLATMSHEIRTPLGGLLGMLELLSLSGLDDKQKDMFQVARNSGKSLLHIVDDILDWSKIEAGKLVLLPRVANIAEMLQNVTNTYAQLASSKGISLEVRVDPGLGTAHLIDPLRVSQILNNFTSNAIKFTERGSVEIRAELLARQDGWEEVRFGVKDSGIGIAREQQARLFRHYEQASADTAHMYGGTGLGLAICRSLAELMEGNLSVESTVGAGSIFWLTVRLPVASPVTQRDLQARAAQAAELAGSSKAGVAPLLADGRSVSILVVDDHPVNRIVLKQQLELLGVRAETAVSGVPALARWQNERFDLIISDCHMPDMDGYELTRNIREIERLQGRTRVPVIAWTANVLAEEEQRSRAAGMDDLLTKPTDLAELREKLSKWLARSESPLATESAADTAMTETAIDFSVLKKIAMRRASQVEMLQEFNRHNRSDLANLHAALQDGNPAAVVRSAHRIKGASHMVGALLLADVCLNMEQLVTRGDMEGARRTAETTLKTTVRQLETEIGHFLGEQKTGCEN